MSQLALLTALIFLAAILYSAVGHAGASGYLAVMAFVGLAPVEMKPTALVLNILVATIAAVRYNQAGAFSWRALWPFLLGSIPLAFLGGAVHLPGHIYRPIVGVVLLIAAARLLWPAAEKGAASVAPHVPLVPAVGSGAAIGLLSGLTGTGGGIFLSPLMLFCGWAQARQTAGGSAAFILANSIAGLAGNVASVRGLPAFLPALLVAAGLGGFIGAELGSRTLGQSAFQRVLTVVLVIAGLKLIFTQ
jgi:uncharacterized protein